MTLQTDKLRPQLEEHSKFWQNAHLYFDRVYGVSVLGRGAIGVGSAAAAYFGVRLGGQWTQKLLAKGKVVPGLSLAENAAKEAMEEAGVVGKVASRTAGSYRTIKRVGTLRTTIDVWVFLQMVRAIPN